MATLNKSNYLHTASSLSKSQLGISHNICYYVMSYLEHHWYLDISIRISSGRPRNLT